MPELPEVETIRRDLNYLQGEEVLAVQVFDERALEGISEEEANARWQGKRLIDVRRRGKYLLFELEEDEAFVVHLRMTGRLLLLSSEAEIDHLRVRFVFKDKALLFADVRRFGRIYPVQGMPEELVSLKRLGPEPLGSQFTVKYLEGVLGKSMRPIKTFLLDQKNVAGLGNIYVDEALFVAGVHPLRSAKTLNSGEIEELYEAIRLVLEKAVVLRGTSFSDYRDGFNKRGSFQDHLSVYGRGGEACMRCGGELSKVKVGGRSTVFCHFCQKG